jgi:triosephosphate isomerase
MKIIACNLKMNLMPSEINDYIEGMKAIKDEILLFPTSIYIDNFVKSGFTTGSQDISYAEKGAYTGDTSILQLKELGIKYSIIGHSERRAYYQDDQYVNKKINLCINNDIMPVLCVGETLEQNKNNETNEVIIRELDSAFTDNNIKSIIIAYEPIWSIGTGLIPSNDFIEEVVNNIKTYIKDKYEIEVSVLYGGSVNADNISTLEEIPNVDGYLIGGSSLKIDSMKKIVSTIRGI